jgi:hypothetical protein
MAKPCVRKAELKKDAVAAVGGIAASLVREKGLIYRVCPGK